MDVEKTIEFILNMQANAEGEMQKIREAQAQAEAREEARAKAQAAALAAHAEAQAAQAKAQAAALEAQAEAAAIWIAHHNRAMDEHERTMDRIDRRLDQAVRLAIREARNERKRRQQANAEWDLKITQIAAAQLETKEAMKGFLESMRRGGNGSH